MKPFNIAALTVAMITGTGAFQVARGAETADTASCDADPQLKTAPCRKKALKYVEGEIADFIRYNEELPPPYVLYLDNKIELLKNHIALIAGFGDPASKKAAKRIKARFEKAAIHDRLDFARRRIADMETQDEDRTVSEIETAVHDIKNQLTAAGKSTAGPMKKRIEEAAAHANLASARRLFADFGGTDVIHDSSWDEWWPCNVRSIKEHLALAGAQAADLDTTGKIPAVEMEARLEKAEARIRLFGARNILAKLEKIDKNVSASPDVFDEYVAAIKENLVLAGEDAAALDPTGKSTVQEMETRIEKASARAKAIMNSVPQALPRSPAP